jgi:hypothetical protein
MLQKPRTLGSVAPELLSHSFAPHFEPFLSVLRPKIHGAITLVFAPALVERYKSDIRRSRIWLADVGCWGAVEQKIHLSRRP